MTKYRRDENDGKCINIKGKECAAMKKASDGCGTFMCPFYKPSYCEGWVRIDHESTVELYSPEEYRLKWK